MRLYTATEELRVLPKTGSFYAGILPASRPPWAGSLVGHYLGHRLLCGMALVCHVNHDAADIIGMTCSARNALIC